jgi:hypothetical protein
LVGFQRPKLRKRQIPDERVKKTRNNQARERRSVTGEEQNENNKTSEHRSLTARGIADKKRHENPRQMPKKNIKKATRGGGQSPGPASEADLPSHSRGKQLNARRKQKGEKKKTHQKSSANLARSEDMKKPEKQEAASPPNGVPI